MALAFADRVIIARAVLPRVNSVILISASFTACSSRLWRWGEQVNDKKDMLITVNTN